MTDPDCSSNDLDCHKRRLKLKAKRDVPPAGVTTRGILSSSEAGVLENADLPLIPQLGPFAIL